MNKRLLMEKHRNTVVDSADNSNSTLNNCTIESVRGNAREMVRDPTSI